jgi:hypothetical protein
MRRPQLLIVVGVAGLAALAHWWLSQQRAQAAAAAPVYFNTDFSTTLRPRVNVAGLTATRNG